MLLGFIVTSLNMPLVLFCVLSTYKTNLFCYINNAYQFQNALAHPDFQRHQDIEHNGLQEENPQPKDAQSQKVGLGIYRGEIKHL